MSLDSDSRLLTTGALIANHSNERCIKVANTGWVNSLMRFKDMKLHFLLIIFLFISFSTYVYSSRAALNNQARNTTSDQDFSFEEDPEGPAVKRLQPPYLQLPIFLHSRIPLVDKEQFSPKVGLGFEQVPEELKKLFFPRAPLTERASSRRRGRAQGVHVVCQLTKMIVKVNKHILGVGGVQYELKLGTCDISKTTKNHHVFIYDMDQCASERKVCWQLFFLFNLEGDAWIKSTYRCSTNTIVKQWS